MMLEARNTFKNKSKYAKHKKTETVRTKRKVIWRPEQQEVSLSATFKPLPFLFVSL